MRPFFCYYGGKWRIAPSYPPPIYDEIVEPFAGAAGYSVRHNARRVHLYDVDECVCGTWDYLIRTPADEIRRLPLYDGTWASTDELTVCQEARWLIGWWLNKGTSHPCKTPSKWTRDGWRPKSTWGPEIRERLASQTGEIRHWTIHRRSWDRVSVGLNATWFVDPPYSQVARGYRKSDVDYFALGPWCRELPGQVIVCENTDATWLPFEPFRLAKATGGKQKTSHQSKEAVCLLGDGA